jgi:hypothetical protein
MTTQDSQELQLPADTLADGFDDDADWDVAPPPRRRLHWTTAVLVIALAAVAAFVGGILVQKHWGGSSSSFTLPGGGRLPSGFPGATAGGATTTGAGSASGFPAGLAQGGFGGGTRGTVSYVDGDILYVSTGSGGVVKVRVPKGLAVDRTVKAKASSIRPGETVVVQGAAGANGAVKATGVTVTAS